LCVGIVSSTMLDGRCDLISHTLVVLMSNMFCMMVVSPSRPCQDYVAKEQRRVHQPSGNSDVLGQLGLSVWAFLCYSLFVSRSMVMLNFFIHSDSGSIGTVLLFLFFGLFCHLFSIFRRSRLPSFLLC